MGWTFYTDRHVQSYVDERAEIEKLCTYSSDLRETKLIKASKVGTTWYAAVKIIGSDAAPLEDKTYVLDADGSITIAAVFLTSYNEGCWGYKDM